jgi:hypothetical protein
MPLIFVQGLRSNFTFFFFDGVLLCSPSWHQTLDPLASASECWNYRHMPAHPASDATLSLVMAAAVRVVPGYMNVQYFTMACLGTCSFSITLLT